jgi:hypothetical protein
MTALTLADANAQRWAGAAAPAAPNRGPCHEEGARLPQ